MCQNRYYLRENDDGIKVCVPHSDVQGCSKYNNVDVDECTTCEDNYFLMNQKT